MTKVTCARLVHAYGAVPPWSLDATQPHASGVPPEGQRRNTCSVLSPDQPVMPGMPASVGLVHDEMSSEPPTGRPLRSIEYRSVPEVAA